MKLNRAMFFLLFITVCLRGQHVYLNEIRANDAGTDDAEFIEIIGPAGTDISGWQIEHINGSGGGSIFLFTFPSGTLIPDDGVSDVSEESIGFVVIKRTGHAIDNWDFEWGLSSLQNGPDGLLLRDDAGQRRQALTWNGSGDLSGGNPPWRNIGDDQNTDNSLSVADSIYEAYQKTWDYVPATPGMLNANQSSGDLSLPVQLSSFQAAAGDNQVHLSWTTESEVENMGFILLRAEQADQEYQEIGSYLTSAALRGAGNSSAKKNYSFVDKSVFNDITYWYCLIDVSRDGVQTRHEPLSVTPESREHESDLIPQRSSPIAFRLWDNFPNPFNPHTSIRFAVPEMGHHLPTVSLSIFDSKGQKIRTLVQQKLTPGIYEIEWDGKNTEGRDVSSGIYYYILRSAEFYQAQKMILIR
jgi:hypothetical protein